MNATTSTFAEFVGNLPYARVWARGDHRRVYFYCADLADDCGMDWRRELASGSREFISNNQERHMFSGLDTLYMDMNSNAFNMSTSNENAQEVFRAWQDNITRRHAEQTVPAHTRAMRRAHEIRRDAATRLNCTTSEIHWGECLRQAWAEIR